MFCENCGKRINDHVTYCPECGAKVVRKPKTIQLKCKSCGGLMEVDPKSQEVTCPFCGYKEKILDSDAVSIEKIKADTEKTKADAYKEVEMAKLAREEEKENRKRKERNHEKYKRSKLNKYTIVLAIICIIACVLAFKSGHILAGIVAAIQAILFIASWLMGLQVIKEKIPYLHIVLFALAVVLVIPFYKADTIKVYDKMDWPTSGIATEIPEPKSKYGNIKDDNDETFYVEVDKTSEKDYKNYVEECKKKGFTIEGDSSDDSYEAFNEEGYKLSIDYYSDDSMKITVDAPEEMGTLDWPTSALVSQLPKPKSMIGKINYEHEDSFSVYIGNTSKEDYQEYVQSVSDAGFNVDYDKGDKYYSAKNANGDSVHVRYEGNNVMSIRIEAPDEEEDSDSDTEDSTSEQETSSNDQQTTASSTVKETMDSYEAFMDQYISFMQTYESSDDTASMLVDYTNMMAQYADFAQKVDALDTESMSEEDYAYYIEVMNRVNTKLANAALQ